MGHFRASASTHLNSSIVSFTKTSTCFRLATRSASSKATDSAPGPSAEPPPQSSNPSPLKPGKRRRYNSEPRGQHAHVFNSTINRRLGVQSRHSSRWYPMTLILKNHRPLAYFERDKGKQVPIPKLNHGLNRVLPLGEMQWVQIPTSHVYQLTPLLHQLPSVESFDFNRIGQFIPSGKDNELLEYARKHEKSFIGSTSSVSPTLSLLYQFLSQEEAIISPKEEDAKKYPIKFTPSTRSPKVITLKNHDGVYSVNSGSEEPRYVDLTSDKNILTWKGMILEKFLTMSPSDFSKYLRTYEEEEASGSEPGSTNSEAGAITPANRSDSSEAYQFSRSGKFILRSQLDCRDDSLPGTGVFDIKTRAHVAIRLDILNWKKSADYQVKQTDGWYESVKREYYDLMRSAGLKYSFQARIGRMDGVFVAYHNLNKIIGCHYIPLKELDRVIFGSTENATAFFGASLQMLEGLLSKAVAEFPGRDVCILAGMTGRVLEIFARPVGEPDESGVFFSIHHRSAQRKHPAPKPGKAMQFRVERTPYRDDTAIVGWRVAMLNKAKSASEMYQLPEDVEPEDMREFWDSMYYGMEGPRKVTDSEWKLIEPKLAYGKTLNPLVNITRKLAAEAREREAALPPTNKVKWSSKWSGPNPSEG